MIAIDSLIPLVAPEAPEASDPAIRQALQLAAQDFFRDTELWRIEDAPITTSSQSVVALGVPTDTTLLAIYTFRANALDVDPSLPSIVAARDPNWMTATGDQVQGYWTIDPDSVRLYPIPNITTTLQACFSVTPTINNLQLPALVQAHVQTLAAGAKWKLQMEVGKAWSNPQRGDQNGSVFNSLCIQAKIRSLKQGAGSVRVKFRRNGT